MNPPSPPPARRRSFGLRLVTFGLSLIACNGSLRLVESLRSAEFLARFDLQPGVGYLAASGALFAAAGLAGALSLWLRRRWGAPLAGAVILLWLGWTWLDRLLVARAPQTAGLPFLLAASLLTLLFCGAVLWKEWRSNRESE
ncbi:MAG: hypothetical protein AB1453_05150 [Chloroflexota bacterium]